MTSDSERREVARTLRLMCESEIPTSDMYTLLDETDRDHQACAIALCGAVGFAVSDEPSIREVILHLASLIDRPTTRRVCKNPMAIHEKWPCERCGFSIGDRRWKYCPHCGAEVVDDEQHEA